MHVFIDLGSHTKHWSLDNCRLTQCSFQDMWAQQSCDSAGSILLGTSNQQSDRPLSLFTSTNVWEQWYSNTNLCCSLNSQTEAVLYSNLSCNWNSTLLGMIYNYWETHQIIRKKPSRLQLGWWPLCGPNNVDFMLPNFPEWSMIFCITTEKLFRLSAKKLSHLQQGGGHFVDQTIFKMSRF